MILFHEQMNDKYLADVTLVTEDDIHITAHKIILGSSSILYKFMTCHKTYSHASTLYINMK